MPLELAQGLDAKRKSTCRSARVRPPGVFDAPGVHDSGLKRWTPPPAFRLMARPRSQLDEINIERLAAIGCSVAEIAVQCDCSKRTLEARYCAAIKRGAKMRKTYLRSWLYREARKGSAAVLIFLAKVELGMKEAPTTAVNVTTAIAKGVPIVTEEVKRRFSEIDRIVREEAERERAAQLNDAPAVASLPAVVNALVRSEQLYAETAKEAAVSAAAAPPGERLESNQLGNSEPKSLYRFSARLLPNTLLRIR